ncbi:MAG: serine/threonine protein kinase, partial [Myxococcales bacterium]|nr:serine/threonine protein kinase [Myxococcales bacterium]
MPLEIGADFDRYRLEALVGQGGMGRVYRAYDARLRRRVALKVLQTTEVDDAIDPERVLREARAAAALDHPGVVAIFDVGAAEGHSFIAMEYVVGRSLRTMIGADAAPISERLRWLVEVARSLAAAHRAGLVHRDIKPENVMVREDGVVKLLDFGIARLSDPHTPVLEDSLGARRSARDESTVAGTPSYMAPEQAQRRRVDARADQFSWGVLAYELLSGALPWRSVLDGVPPSVAVITERPAPLDAAALDLPTLVAEVIGRALEKAPERRFPTMDALVAALEDDGPMWLSDAPGGEVGHPTIPEGGTTRAMTPPPHPAGRRVRPRTLGLVGVALAGV